MFNPKKNYLFKCRLKNGNIVDWSGRFSSRKMATKWYNKNGHFWENMGYELILINNNGVFKKINVFNGQKLIGSIFTNETEKKYINDEISLMFEFFTNYKIARK